MLCEKGADHYKYKYKYKYLAAEAIVPCEEEAGQHS